MDDLPPEDDLKPDTSDRRPPRSRKPSSPAPKLPVSRQYLMMGIGIIVLLLLILGIGSALKSPSSNTASAPSNGPKDISLSGGDSTPAAGNSAAVGIEAAPVQAPNAQTPANTDQTAGNQPKSIGLPPVSSTPTEAQPQVNNGQKERVDLPGDMNDALTQQQGQVDAAAQEGTQSLTSLPTGPATVNSSIKGRAPASTAVTAAPRSPVKAPSAEHRSASRNEHTTPARTPVAKASEPARKPETRKEAERHTAAPAKVAVESGSASALKTAPGSHYTLQLSGASQANSLNTFARQQGLKNFYVYQTARDGKPWFVLVSGNYASSAEAKRAIASLPADVQAKKPWVKPVHQVQQDLKK
ncbi:SPOR domain-containing protein [Rouxiella chamberiensis]|uniref:Cell division protein DamX n=1 Tax=Rouxiella chamberiensis TaxID=1513468 RepID=A0ABY7HPK5_9GAMM|nr:SPOR domain-containing protein [Rouxiella chamberiensis]WAT00821.1 SPOR domain-containing protein [Rouxiella chamberiensis]